VRTLSLEEFAAEARATHELVVRLVEVGAIEPLPNGRFDSRDEIVASTARAMLDAGIELDDLAWTLERGQFGLRSLGRIFSEPQPRTPERYADLAASLGEDAHLLSAVYAALELPEPEPDDHPRADEAELLLGFVGLWSMVDSTGEAHVRVARLVGEATRRIAEGWLDVWDEVARPDPTTQGAPTVGPAGRPSDPTDPAQNLSFTMADLARRLVSLAHERQTETTLNARIISAIERVLGESGRLPARSPRPPAIAFVDLSGFTTLTEERGDEEAARVASALHELVDRTARVRGGRVVKQLGDGVLARFGGAEDALLAVREVVSSVGQFGLPPAHAGIAAGPVIVRDGDVFGRTVNLAARLAAVAKPGETLVEEGVVVALPRRTARFAPLGRIELRGVSEPVAVWRLLVEATPTTPRMDGG
jgi:adenylate cyclase